MYAMARDAPFPAVSLAYLSRGNVFLPVTRVKEAPDVFRQRREYEIDRLQISTPLFSQRHADMLEAILFWGKWISDRIIVVDPYVLRKRIVGGSYVASLGTVMSLVNRLVNMPPLVIKERKKNVYVDVTTGVFFKGFEKSWKMVDNPLKTVDVKLGSRSIWAFNAGRLLRDLLQRDVLLNYDPTPIIQMRYGISKSITRFLITHRFQPTNGWFADRLIKRQLGEDASESRVRKMLANLESDGELLEKFGIEVKGDRILCDVPPNYIEYDVRRKKWRKKRRGSRQRFR